jgi:phage terminase small subunit
MRDRFVLEYLKDFNAMRAAIRSGNSAAAIRRRSSPSKSRPYLPHYPWQ